MSLGIDSFVRRCVGWRDARRWQIGVKIEKGEERDGKEKKKYTAFKYPSFFPHTHVAVICADKQGAPGKIFPPWFRIRILPHTDRPWHTFFYITCEASQRTTTTLMMGSSTIRKGWPSQLYRAYHWIQTSSGSKVQSTRSHKGTSYQSTAQGFPSINYTYNREYKAIQNIWGRGVGNHIRPRHRSPSAFHLYHRFLLKRHSVSKGARSNIPSLAIVKQSAFIAHKCSLDCGIGEFGYCYWGSIHQKEGSTTWWANEQTPVDRFRIHTLYIMELLLKDCKVKWEIEKYSA